MATAKFTIGTDLEFMLTRKGKLVSAVPVLGPKGRNLPYGKIFFDNVLAEFTVEPAKSRDAFIEHVSRNLDEARKQFKKDGIDVLIASSARYPISELETPEARLFGCSPSFCAYELKQNEVGKSADETDLRTAGGHIHVGHPIFEDPYKIVDMVKLMDVFLGVPSVLLDNTPEAIERRTLYGRPGEHRPKEYGPEYRSLSNFWVKSEELIGWVYDRTATCLNFLLENETAESLGYDSNEVRRIITTGDAKAAKKMKV